MTAITAFDESNRCAQPSEKDRRLRTPFGRRMRQSLSPRWGFPFFLVADPRLAPWAAFLRRFAAYRFGALLRFPIRASRLTDSALLRFPIRPPRLPDLLRFRFAGLGYRIPRHFPNPGASRLAETWRLAILWGTLAAKSSISSATGL